MSVFATAEEPRSDALHSGGSLDGLVQLDCLVYLCYGGSASPLEARKRVHMIRSAICRKTK